ncbi:structural protein P5 [Marinobacter sp. NP-6]|nr:structural protein P5 [Marinobacter sp. NP-6]
MRADTAGEGSDVPRGIRNNNPGNLENNGIAWQGLSSSQTDSRFYQFVNPVWGIRALARTLKTYRERYGLDTANEIISRWAPAFENNTDAYARAVADALGTDPETVITDSEENRLRMVKAIIRHENGAQPYPDDLIREGIARAYA